MLQASENQLSQQQKNQQKQQEVLQKARSLSVSMVAVGALYQ